MELPTSTPNRFTEFSVERGVEVPMRDGVMLSANVFRPATAEPSPAVLIRQPYGKDDHPTMWARGKYWARKGYVCVIQDVRGKFGSEGEWAPFVNEAADGYDTLDWVARQPWCDGAVAMAGESYHGITQWAVVASGHPNLRCVAIGDSSPDSRVLAYRGGAFLLPIAVWCCAMRGRGIEDTAGFDPWHLPLATIGEAAGLPNAVLRDFLEHPTRDEYWEARDYRRALADVRIPVLHWGGWYDILLPGTLEGWRAVAEECRDRQTRDRQRLVIGPTDHTLVPAAYGGGYAPLGSAGAWTFDRVQRFFDHWVRGEENGLLDSPRVSVFMMGAERWLELPDWPPPASTVDYYLHSGSRAGDDGDDGRLETAVPAEEPADSFIYDPRHPVDTWLGESLWDLSWSIREREAVERRADVLVYTSPELDRSLEVVGPVSVTLYAASSAPDTDFAAALVDVFPDGRTCLVQEGLMRARFREGDGEEKLLAPEEIACLTIDLCATAYSFAPGHRVRLEVSSSIFGRHDRNLNTGRPCADDTAGVVARQAVHHSSAYPSRLTLPVMPGDGSRVGS